MLILFLDDQEIRHEGAEKHFAKEHTLLHAFDMYEAVDVIKSCKQRIGLAMLDHDLFHYENLNGIRVSQEYKGKKLK